MELDIVVPLITLLVGAFLGIIGRKDTDKSNRELESEKAVWSNLNSLRMDLDKVKSDLSDHKNSISKDYYDKTELREYLSLSLQPIMEQMGHIDDAVEEIKTLLKEKASA